MILIVNFFVLKNKVDIYFCVVFTYAYLSPSLLILYTCKIKIQIIYLEIKTKITIICQNKNKNIYRLLCLPFESFIFFFAIHYTSISYI
jgi:hypothetical protein